jgi:formamidopyrimidine-DNA glycosylase
MSGSLRITSIGESPRKHDHVCFEINQQQELRFHDPRRFGCVLWTEENPLQHKLLKDLGPEPSSEEFNGNYLHQRSRKRKTAVKTFLMDSKIVVGVGNIYANEALFMSGIRPTKAVGRLSKEHCHKLASNIKRALDKAIAMGGTTLKDFVNANGQPGYFQQTLNVYDRKGLPCPNCGKTIKHVMLNQRSSFYCPDCQQ